MRRTCSSWSPKNQRTAQISDSTKLLWIKNNLQYLRWANRLQCRCQDFRINYLCEAICCKVYFVQIMIDFLREGPRHAPQNDSIRESNFDREQFCCLQKRWWFYGLDVKNRFFIFSFDLCRPRFNELAPKNRHAYYYCF